MQFLQEYGGQILTTTLEHLYISLIALFLGALVAIPLGIVLTRAPKIANTVLGITSALQTIPSLALLTLMIPFLGVGRLPAIVALFIYSLLPILRNTYIGLKNVDENYLDAAKGMGMTASQSIIQVELPLALPTIMAGLRLAAVYVIAWASLASYIGAGGLGGGPGGLALRVRQSRPPGEVAALHDRRGRFGTRLAVHVVAVYRPR